MSAVLTRRSRPNRVIVPSSPSCHPPSYRLRLPPTGRFLEHAPHLAAKTTKLLCSGACLFAAISWHTTTINSGLINKSKNNRRQHDDKITQSHKKDIFFFPTATHKITVLLSLVPAQVQSYKIYVTN